MVALSAPGFQSKGMNPIEVPFGTDLGEDNIVRIKDVYSRGSTTAAGANG